MRLQLSKQLLLIDKDARGEVIGQMLPFTESKSIGGSADMNTSIFVMEASYRNVSCPGTSVTAVAK